MKRVATVVLGVLSAAAVGRPQPEHRFTFEVASVKVNDGVSTNSSINRKDGGRLECTNVSLRLLIGFAYNLRDYQLVNLPAWAGTERYDIAAKPPEDEGKDEPKGGYSEVAAARMRERARGLLAERFGLVTHTEDREMSIYALVPAKGGPKLTESKAENGPSISWGNREVSCKKVTMQRFAEVLLSARMERKVLDQTGLTGEYDFKMTFAPDPGVSSKPGVMDTSAPDDSAPTFMTALQEQLGLKLVPTKGPVPFLVVDKVDHPSSN